jgi:hypothetical protein
MIVLTPKRSKTHSYPDQHALTYIDSVDLVLTKNDGFDLRWLETHFLS